jgi:CDGSH-type Zn-finger protein
MPVKITTLPNGPLKIEGDCEIVDAGGKAIEVKTRAAGASADAYLCRCGQSANKPFCDGAHNKAGFKAP